MMHYKIDRKDGGVEIMQCFGDADPKDEIAKWHPDRQAEIIAGSVAPIDPAKVPTDRTFRNAWNPDLSHDMDKCRDIQRDRLRNERAPLLAALDVEYQRADEDGDSTKKLDIANRKRELRDITQHPAIASATTPEQLKTLSCSELSRLSQPEALQGLRKAISKGQG